MTRYSRVLCVPCHSVDAVVDALVAIGPKTAIVDVEPMIAYWDTDQATLDAGLRDFLDAAAGRVPPRCDIVFATNALRRPSSGPTRPGRRIGYVADARKPLTVARFLKLAGPGVVVGDQIATDGVLAWRLGFTFVYYNPGGLELPRGPRLMRALGRPLERPLFRNP
ncbi:hypothetical protein KDK95_20270 [Actinospica sp. MGRD01-02]|uniref:Uncharacterized protein n=1 Tax=Actinospica acidithermotolerans TaxID=2828514 RepID=A0A941IMK7_9ACTN|nr:hypothetical protein [Actinospica acidithermotolerans]MBR7828656.1 hypothetical protein [Actinospica acidithermotolerans]